jgi:DNA-binding transcriptional LysR family regulator
VDIIAAFKTFVRVAETESFSSAARDLGVGQPAVSKQISALEEYLGTRLFQRTTRTLVLTDEGQEFLSHAQAAIEAVDEATDRMRRRKGKVSGTLRMTTTASFARLHVVPRLSLFKAQYPDLKIDLVLQDQATNLVEQGIDLGIRFGEPREMNVIAKRMGNIRMIAVASKAYLDKHGRPETPQDLAKHECIVFSGTRNVDNMPFIVDGRQIDIKVNWNMRMDNSDALREAALCDLGIVMAPSWLFSDLWRLDTMETVLDNLEKPTFPMYAIYPSRRFTPGKVRAMIDFLEYEIRLDPSMTGEAVLI